MNEEIKSKVRQGEVIQLSSLVDYQPAAVVSRMLVQKPSGNVTLFAFDEGQGLSEHTATFDAFVYIIEGSAVMTTGGKDNTLSSGEMIVIPAGVPHSVKADVKFKMLLVMIK